VVDPWLDEGDEDTRRFYEAAEEAEGVGVHQTLQGLINSWVPS
jgi:hypothetical protein